MGPKSKSTAIWIYFYLVIEGKRDTAGIIVEEWVWTLPKDDFSWEESFKLPQSFSEGQKTLIRMWKVEVEYAFLPGSILIQIWGNVSCYLHQIP